MTRDERLRILGAETVAEIHRLVDAAPPPTPEAIEDLRRIFAPIVARRHAREAANANQVVE